MQKYKLIRHSHIELRLSPINGYGVFATEDIAKDEILEEIPFVTVESNTLGDYAFLYPKFDTPAQENVKKINVIPWGFACIYNHSDQPNADWKTDIENEIFIFYTKTKIKKNEEIFTFYGDESYWKIRRHIKKI